MGILIPRISNALVSEFCVVLRAVVHGPTNWYVALAVTLENSQSRPPILPGQCYCPHDDSNGRTGRQRARFLMYVARS